MVTALKRIAIVGLMVLVTFPVFAQEFIKLTDSQIEIVQQGVRDSLKDPSSAIFDKEYYAFHTKGNIIVCGTVNARNSFGGYTGDKAFAGLMLPDVIFGPFDTEGIPLSAKELCKELYKRK